MSRRTIQVGFESGQTENLILDRNSVADVILWMVKHLQKVPLPFHLLDNPYNGGIENVLPELVAQGKAVGLEIDTNRIHEQEYLNHIHDVYATTYTKTQDATWLKFHEAIHGMEYINHRDPRRIRTTNMSYRHLGGLLVKKFTEDHYSLMTTKLVAGECYVHFTELGKIPYDYWKDEEPDDFDRFCALAKPYLNFTPKISVAMHDTDLLPDTDTLDRFNQWYEPRKDAWCKHWGINKWDTVNIFGVMPIGHVENFPNFDQLLKNKDRINKLTIL